MRLATRSCPNVFQKALDKLSSAAGWQPALPRVRYLISSIKAKELFRGFGRGFRQFLQRNFSGTRDRFGHETGICRFAPFAPKWHRREIRTIGFHHEFPERNLCRDRADGSAIFESHDPGKGNEMIEIDYFICLFKRAAKAMKHAPHLVSVGP